MATIGSAKATLVNKIDSLTSSATAKDTIFLAKALKENSSLNNFVWQGTWVATTAYYVDDVVTNDGNTYMCVTEHTSGASFAVGSNWSIMAAGGTDVGTGTAGQVLKTNAAGTGIEWGADEGGKILQVKQTEFTGTPQFSASNNWQTISGFYVNITPSSASSKILVTANIGYGGNAPQSTIRLTRNGTNTHADGWILAGYTNSFSAEIVSGSHLDSPNTTSQVTYQLLIRTHATNWSFINRDEGNTYPSTSSTITVMEIGA
jgi:hypothetical protein